MKKLYFLSVILFFVLTAASKQEKASWMVRFVINPSEFIANGTVDGDIPAVCEGVIEKQFTFKIPEGGLPVIAENIDDICLQFEEVAPCFRYVRKIVTKELKIELVMTLDTMDFLCSDIGRTGLKDYRDSPCFNHNETIQEIGNLIRICANSTEKPADGDSPCFAVRTLEECGFKVFTDVCGVSVGVFIREVNMVILRQMPFLQMCFMDNVVEVHDYSLMFKTRKE